LPILNYHKEVMTAALYVCLAVALVVITRLAVVCRASLKERRHSDPLTRLPNRPGFEAIVADHLKLDLPFSIVWLDLDGFRKLNELHCYSSGDILLGQIGPRIRRCLRPGDAAARFGGDQFLILLRGHDATAGITARILGSVNATVGVSLYPNHADSPSELLLSAETAMRQAKISARGHVLFYQPSMAANSFRSAEIAGLIQSALANDRFRLVYQPIVDADGQIVRMEALVRIDDPVLGRVAPLEFIGVAEKTGLIFEVGAWILRRACQQAREWRDAGLETQVTINLSPLQLESNKLTDAILNEISQCGLRKSAITVHLTGEVKSAGPVERLRTAGVIVSSQEPLFDEIRVKSPFSIPAGQRGLTVIAQGIEKPEQLDRARAAGCHLFQGFQIAPPLEPGDATEMLRSGLFAGVGGYVSR
jgi:diguanylate cyclase (GGDEF)-like protein